MDKKRAIKSGIYLFTLFGFEVRLDWTWFFLAILVAWTLAVGYFPVAFKGLSITTYWIMGIFGAVGLFLSIILHELSHSLVGRYYGLPIAGIKLFIFGGVAEMSDEPPSPKAEFFMAIVGPIFSIVLGIFFNFLFQVGLQARWPIPINGVLHYLGIINFMVGIFNLFPGFPLDGGRVLRSLLWWWKKDLKWATKVASYGGTGMGYGLIFFGILLFIRGSFIGGLWLFLIGFFILQISKMSYQQLLVKEAFRGESIRKYVKTDPITVQPNLTLQELIDNYFYKYHHKLYPVTENARLVGYITLNEIKQHPREKWPYFQIRDIMVKCTPENTIDVTTEVTQVLQKMSDQKKSRLIVTDHNQLYGVITLKDLIEIVSIKMSLEED